MAVTDLTNTKWLFNERPNLQDYSEPGEQYYVNFTSYYNNFTSIYLGHDGPLGNVIRYTGGVYAYYEDMPNSWTNQEYRTVEITGGTDVTNSSLISWLEANATQIPTATPKETFETNISALNDALNEKAGTTGQHTIAQMIDVAESILGTTITINQDNTIDLTIV